MESWDQDPRLQRDVLRRVFVRLICHWVLFFSVTVILATVLEFLFGEPGAPSLALVGHTFQKYLVPFMALLVLIPISMRDCLKYIERAVFLERSTKSQPWQAPKVPGDAGDHSWGDRTNYGDADDATAKEPRHEKLQTVAALDHSPGVDTSV